MVVSNNLCQQLSLYRMLCTFLMLLSVVPVSHAAADSNEDIFKLYSNGKDAYRKEKWSLCVRYIGASISLYNRYKQTLLQCAIKCKKEHVNSYTDLRGQGESMIEYIVKGNLLSERDCLVSCQGSIKAQTMDNSHESNFPKEFERMKPYYYIQHCLNKVGEVVNAASAAYTFLVRNSGYDDVLSMLGAYKYQHSIRDYMIIDLEERPYVTHRKNGETAYRLGKWADAVEHFEAALKEYYIEDELCRSQCDLGHRSTSSGLIKIIVDGMAAVLQCQQGCSNTLAHLYGQTYSDYLTDHYLYLQDAYVKTNDYVNALEAANTYLSFKPEDQQVRQFRDKLLKKLEKSDSELTLRQDAVRYIETRKRITYLLDEFLGSEHQKSKYYKGFGDGVIQESSEEIESRKPEPNVSNDIDFSSRLENMRLFNTSQTLNYLFKTLSADVALTGEALKDDKRVVMDNLFTKEVCDDVMRLSQNGIKNAGYHDNYPTAVRPNFAKELFTGFDIMDCWELVLGKQLRERDVDLLTRLAEQARQLVVRWFNETRPIYHDYTQFTCRKALDGKQTNRTSEDLSHPVHGDSCDFKPSKGVCETETAAYPWRTYSAVMYFNDDFEGGKFFFANPDQSEQVSIVPKCGRMVAFPSDHLHGVKAVTKGKRCAATIWFTATASRRQARPTWSGIVK